MLLAEVEKKPSVLKQSRIGKRYIEALSYLADKGSAAELSDHLRHLADQDFELTQANFGLTRFICWVTPMFGFLGTVIHFGTALSGQEATSLGDNLPTVVAAMGTAFNATTVALSAATTMMFCLFLGERTERGIILAIDGRVERDLLNRFEVADPSLAPFLSAVEAANQTTLSAVADQVERQMNAWQQALVALQQHAEAQAQWQAETFVRGLEKFQERVEANEQKRESGLASAITALAAHSSEHHGQINASLQQVVGVQQQFAHVASTLSGMLEGEQHMVKLQSQLADNLRLLHETQQPRPGDARIDRRHPHANRPQSNDRQFAGQSGLAINQAGRRRNEYAPQRTQRQRERYKFLNSESRIPSRTLSTLSSAFVLFSAFLLSSLRVLCVLCGAILLLFPIDAQAETVARCGRGWLERIDGYPVLHLKGTPYEIGYQHGALLKEDVRANLDYLVNVQANRPLKLGPVPLSPQAAIASIVGIQWRHVPLKYFDEMAGLAAASGLKIEEVRMGNFIPELFHCSGFAVMDSATVDGTLYHGRVLDYAIDWQLQDHAVLIVCEPDGEIPFVNISYAGFIGSVTGMNSRHVSIGEMGGGGLGHWDGMPMALLVREVLQSARDLDEAIAMMRDHPRTCQYFYVVADGNTNRAVGMEASWDRFETIQPGQAHPLLNKPVKDTVLLSSDRRYDELARRAKDRHGHIDVEGALRLMDLPVALKSNLHDVLFAPKSTDLWVANASHDRKPAATQPYAHFNLAELLVASPIPRAQAIPLPGGATAADRTAQSTMSP